MLDSSKAFKDERQKTDDPILTVHSTHTAVVENGPGALSACFLKTRGFFSHSAPLQWFRKVQAGSAPT